MALGRYARCASGVHAVADSAQDLLDLKRSEVAVEQIERNHTTERAVWTLQPRGSALSSAERLFGQSTDAAQAQQPVRLIGPKSSFLLPPGQGPRGQGKEL